MRTFQLSFAKWDDNLILKSRADPLSMMLKSDVKAIVSDAKFWKRGDREAWVRGTQWVRCQVLEGERERELEYDRERTSSN